MFVLDASALAKSFLDEAGSEEFRAWLSETSAKGMALQAPHIAYSELGRVIQKECRDLKVAEAKELHRAVFLGIDLIPLNTDDDRVWDAATGVTYYDAEYLEAAVSTGGTLVSADDRQLQAARKLGIKVISFSPTKGRKKQA
ncbi:MAG: type II toxin-antitoxin system VapC family toxin [Euryarchaeota archaeon]|nr:type II toxin-antitoxin system VapC family toxin [Euryarchaeota archaeon]